MPADCPADGVRPQSGRRKNVTAQLISRPMAALQNASSALIRTPKSAPGPEAGSELRPRWGEAGGAHYPARRDGRVMLRPSPQRRPCRVAGRGIRAGCRCDDAVPAAAFECQFPGALAVVQPVFLDGPGWELRRALAPPKRGQIGANRVKQRRLAGIVAVAALLDAARPPEKAVSPHPTAIARRNGQPEMRPRMTSPRMFQNAAALPNHRERMGETAPVIALDFPLPCAQSRAAARPRTCPSADRAGARPPDAARHTGGRRGLHPTGLRRAGRSSCPGLDKERGDRHASHPNSQSAARTPVVVQKPRTNRTMVSRRPQLPTAHCWASRAIAPRRR